MEDSKLTVFLSAALSTTLYFLMYSCIINFTDFDRSLPELKKFYIDNHPSDRDKITANNK